LNGRDAQHLQYIRKYCEAIADSIGRFGTEYDAFANDWDYFQSVSMSIMQIGEHTKGLSQEFIESTSGQVPWHAIRGARNMVAHEYVKLDKAQIWETACGDIPKLRLFCEQALEQNGFSDDRAGASSTLSVKERLRQKHHSGEQEKPEE
jgi:uncharacterized protein with HEPN domain